MGFKLKLLIILLQLCLDIGLTFADTSYSKI